MKKVYLFMLAVFVLVWGLGAVMAEDAILEEGTRGRSIQRAVFKVENMTCGACFSNINVGLSPLEGFSGMGVNLLRKLLAVDFVSPLSADEIGAAITRQGYPATLESVDIIMEKEAFAVLNTRRKGSGSGGGCCSGGNAVAGKEPLPQPGIPSGDSCCTLPNGSSLPPATTN